MSRWRRGVIGIWFALVLLARPVAAPSAGEPAARAAACPSDVVVVGADLSAGQRASVLARLGAAPSSTYLVESLAAEQSQAEGLIPPALLGLVAISSARLTSLPQVGGLTVRTDASITLDTAAMYARALGIAGIRHAEVRVTAPPDATALGTTALLGLLRAARAACLNVPPERARLAIRELVFTSHVADAYGGAAASTLLSDALLAAQRTRATGEAALGTIVDRAVVQAGTPLRAQTRDTLVGLLADLGSAAQRYPDLAAPASVQATGGHLASLAPPGTPRPATAPAATTLKGVAAGVAHGALSGVFGGQTLSLGHEVGHLVVTRNGRPARLEDVRRGDAVTVRTDARGLMVRLDAHGAAAPAPTPAPTPAPAPGSRPAGLQGTVVAAHLTSMRYVPRGATAGRTVAAWPGLRVTRNGHRATLADLRAGDSVVLRLDARGRVIDVAASGAAAATGAQRGGSRPLHGVLSAVTGGMITFTEGAGGSATTVVVASDATILHDGKPAALAALQAGDTLTVTLATAGVAGEIAASGAARPIARVVPPAAQAGASLSVLRQRWPFVLLGGLIVLGVLLLGLRWLPLAAGPLPFALVDRRTDDTGDAAAPATCELTRRARVLCPDGEEGRLAHVVVIPRSGALLRLIVRDRSDVLREVPAHLIAGTSPAAVRLVLTWPELQATLDSRPPFSPRRYKRLPIDRNHPRDGAPLIQSTADSLRIEVDGAPRL